MYLIRRSFVGKTSVLLKASVQTVPHAGFPGGLVVKSLPANEEMHIPSLGGEDPLEEEMATHSSIPRLGNREAWRAPFPGVAKSQTRLKNQTTTESTALTL